MIDLSYFAELSSNNSEFLIRIMNLFINETPEDLIELQNSFNNSDYKLVKEMSHKLKGLFKSYKMVELVNGMLELENQAKDSKFTEESKVLLEKILSQYNQKRLEMIDHLQNFKD